MFGCRDSDSKGDDDDAITFDFNELKMKIDKKEKKKEIEWEKKRLNIHFIFCGNIQTAFLDNRKIATNINEGQTGQFQEKC